MTTTTARCATCGQPFTPNQTRYHAGADGRGLHAPTVKPSRLSRCGCGGPAFLGICLTSVAFMSIPATVVALLIWQTSGGGR